ncbi:hypothetical protein HMPREF3190_00831 [Umbribacter vaginalis]|nr:hypothetical protein HMPREF3190_00831 [Coriobacteriales bacterium DNF00809]
MRLHFSGIILAITEYHVACSGTIRRNENENTCSITRKVRNIHEKQTKSKRKQTQKQTQIFTSPCKLPAKTSMARTANKRTANENKRKSKRILFRFFLAKIKR